VAALELLAGVDGGEVGQFLLARDLVGRALDNSGHGRAANVLLCNSYCVARLVARAGSLA